MTHFGLKKVALFALANFCLINTSSWAAPAQTPELSLGIMSAEGQFMSCTDNLSSCVMTLHASAPNTPHSLFIRNNSNRTVFNIVATLPAGYSDIRQNGTTCRTVAPHTSCNINFRPSLNITHPTPATVFVSGVGTSVDTFTLIVVN